MQNSILMCFIKGYILVGQPLSERTVFDACLLEQHVIKHRLTYDEIMGVKLHSAVYPPVI